MNPWIWIPALGIGTLLIRASFLVGSGDREPPAWVGRVLRLVPAAVLSALVTPALLYPGDAFALSIHNERLVAGIVAAIVAWKTRNVSVTLVVGMLVLWSFRLWS